MFRKTFIVIKKIRKRRDITEIVSICQLSVATWKTSRESENFRPNNEKIQILQNNFPQFKTLKKKTKNFK